MIALIIFPFYVAILIWACSRWYKFVDTFQFIDVKYFSIIKRLSFVFFILTLCIGIGFILPDGKLKRIFTQIGSYWLGISIYFILSICIVELLRIVFKSFFLDKYNHRLVLNICTAIVILFTSIMSTYGIINAKTVRQTNYSININKKCNIDKLKIALLADTHLGFSIGKYHIKQAVDIINNNDVDLVVIAGDIFDNDFEAIENPNEIANLLSTIKSKNGTYAVLGNHDVEEKILCGFTFNGNEEKSASNEMLEFIKDSNIKLLYDESIEIDNSLYLYGRPDYERPNFNHEKNDRLAALSLTEKMDKNKPIICIDHEPRELKELEKAGVDLLLSGHTHDGQLWPLKYINYLVWENPYGIYKLDSITSIVTSGLGLYGPNMRTFTKSEVCIIDVDFN